MTPDSGQTHPLVSAVIPTRNRPELVCRAVRSVLNQTYRNLEVVVVVDGPDPATVAAVEALKDSRVRTVALAQSVGGSEARNVGAREATGEWIGLLDDDDEWMPRKIERQMCLAGSTGADRKAVLVFCMYQYRRPGKADQIWPRILPGNEHISEFMFDRRSGFQTSTFLVPRAYLVSHPFVKGLKGHQDWDWFLRAASDPHATIQYVNEPLSIFYVAPQVKRTSYSFQWRDSLAWGKASRALMTDRAYSRFIANHCLRLAKEQGDVASAFVPLANECFLHGSPTLETAATFGAVAVLTPAARRGLHDLLNARVDGKAANVV